MHLWAAAKGAQVIASSAVASMWFLIWTSWTGAYLFRYSTHLYTVSSHVATYIMHIVHAVKSLQGPEVTSLRFTSRFKTPRACTRVVSLSRSVPEWISIRSPRQLCCQQGTWEEKQPGLPQPAWVVAGGTAVYPFCSLNRKQPHGSAAALPKGHGVWQICSGLDGAARFSLVIKTGHLRSCAGRGHPERWLCTETHGEFHLFRSRVSLWNSGMYQVSFCIRNTCSGACFLVGATQRKERCLLECNAF